MRNKTPYVSHYKRNRNGGAGPVEKHLQLSALQLLKPKGDWDYEFIQQIVYLAATAKARKI